MRSDICAQYIFGQCICAQWYMRAVYSCAVYMRAVNMCAVYMRAVFMCAVYMPAVIYFLVRPSSIHIHNKQYWTFLVNSLRKSVFFHPHYFSLLLFIYLSFLHYLILNIVNRPIKLWFYLFKYRDPYVLHSPLFSSVSRHWWSVSNFSVSIGEEKNYYEIFQPCVKTWDYNEQ